MIPKDCEVKRPGGAEIDNGSKSIRVRYKLVVGILIKSWRSPYRTLDLWFLFNFAIIEKRWRCWWLLPPSCLSLDWIRGNSLCCCRRSSCANFGWARSPELDPLLFWHNLKLLSKGLHFHHWSQLRFDRCGCFISVFGLRFWINQISEGRTKDQCQYPIPKSNQLA